VADFIQAIIDYSKADTIFIAIDYAWPLGDQLPQFANFKS
jgi:hypothetical protein